MIIVTFTSKGEKKALVGSVSEILKMSGWYPWDGPAEYRIMKETTVKEQGVLPNKQALEELLKRGK